MNILGIETSCDETAAAVVKDGFEVVSSIVYSQIPLHTPYGGVVPEVAGRAHVAKIASVLENAIAGVERIDAVAVTYGPGLAGALLVGVNAAKGFAARRGIPLIAVNHLQAHLHTPFLFDSAAIHEEHNLAPNGENAPRTAGKDEWEPALGLVVSGGHTTWLDMPRRGEYRLLGQTLDDAAGEAFDKAAKLLDLGYPGGPKVDRLARAHFNGIDFSKYAGIDDFMADAALKKLAYPAKCTVSPPAGYAIPQAFPKGNPREGTAALAGLEASLCVSFSGLKTALLRHVQAHEPKTLAEKAALVAAYQEAIAGSLADRTMNALRRTGRKRLIVGGGVSLNGRLRQTLGETARKCGAALLTAAPKYCGDNAAMIAGLAFFNRQNSGFAFDAVPNLPAWEK